MPSLKLARRSAIFFISLLIPIFFILFLNAGDLYQAGLADPDVAVPAAAAGTQTTITVSGTITKPGGPAAGVTVYISSPPALEEVLTDGNGFYSATIETAGQLWIHVRPDVTMRLSQANFHQVNVTGDVSQDFSLVDGYLLDLQVLGNGAVIHPPLWFECQPLENRLPDHQWYQVEWDEAVQRFRAVLPPDIYYLTVTQPPTGFYQTTEVFDLRAADQNPSLALNTSYLHPIPYDPPDAAKITIGPPDDLGEATVTGAPGAALPLARVFLVNLNANNQEYTISEGDGSFTSRIFAPPGSALMIKHGPASERWKDLSVGVIEGLNPFPGTIIHVPQAGSATATSLPFSAAGFIEQNAQTVAGSTSYVNSTWSITGTLEPVNTAASWQRVITGTYEGNTQPGLYLGGLNWTHPTLADLDDDGPLELLVGAEGGRLLLFGNQGTTATPDWQLESVDYAGLSTNDGWVYPQLVDVTADGAPDLFLGHGDGTVSIYYNRGTPSVAGWPATPDVTLAAGTNNAPALADLDNDLDLDLVVGHQAGSLYHFQNTGTVSDPTWAFVTSTYGGFTETTSLQPAFVNLDGDADLDLLLGQCGGFIWYERAGPAANPTWTRHAEDPIGYGGGSCGNSPGLGDWSGDGQPDIAVGEHWGVLRFFRHAGPPNWPEQFPFSFPFELMGDTAPALADWDNNGLVDMLVGQVHGQLQPYTNTGTLQEPDWVPGPVSITLPWTNHPHPFPAFADIDGDDDYDLFIGEGGWQSETGAGGNIHFYRNDGSPTAPDWTLMTSNFLDLDVGGWSTPVFVDIDGDDDQDLFIGDEAGTLTYLENTGSPTAPAWGPPIHPYWDLDLGDYSAPAFLDVDQDGLLDMMVGLGDGSLAYVRNIGTANAPAWQLVAKPYPGIHTGSHATPAAVDLNGDGDRDLLIGDGDGGLNLYLYEGQSQPPGDATHYQPGDLFHISGTIRLHGHAITATTDIESINVIGQLHWQMLSDPEGHPLAPVNTFMSSVLTPSGLPVQGFGKPSVSLMTPVLIHNLHYAGGHLLQGDFDLTVQVPADSRPGVYQPQIYFYMNNVPKSYEWLAAYVSHYTYDGNVAPLPPLTVGDAAPSRLIWRLLMDDFVQGTRGTGTLEDAGLFALASDIVTQGAPYYTPPVDPQTGQPITYRLEPFLPRISFAERRMPAPPMLPFELPGGQLCVTIRQPDATLRDLGCDAFDQSFNRTKTTRYGNDLNVGTVQLNDVYSLKTPTDRFRVTFGQYGRHVITMTGTIDDIWGNTYAGGGSYELWLAQPLDLDPGVLPGTPLAVGDAFNPALQFYPRVPAEVLLTLTHFPDSDPDQAQIFTRSGQANDYGAFSLAGDPIVLASPGEYRVDVVASYEAPDGTLYMGTMTWGSVVMTPENQADLIAHGRRGLDSLTNIPDRWFITCTDLPIAVGAISHTYNPYYNGDLVWSRMIDAPGECPPGVTSGGDSLILGASVQDKIGTIKALVQTRANRMGIGLTAPGDLTQRLSKEEIPLFTSSRSGQPAQFVLRQIGPDIPPEIDQIAYSYRSSQRPGIRIREVVAEESDTGGYWRLDTLYDDQLSVGVFGDQPNDFKFQYIGTVYRDLDAGHAEYGGQGSGWIFIPDSDTTGGRVMPPFAGPGNGGWRADGGPILTLKGQAIHIFILPTGVLPGAILETGDTFRFAGHIMPTLDSQVAVTVTAPGGAQHLVSGRANPVGYFYDPADDFTLTEPGLWTVDVRVWHDGQIGTGEQVNCDPADPFDPAQPCPAGDVLGSANGRYTFYVVPPDADPLAITAPSPGFLHFDWGVTPITVTGRIPAGLTGLTVDYTIAMPGYILDQGQATITGDTFSLLFDPIALNQDFPNLDLTGRDGFMPGLADTFSINLLLQGQDGGHPVRRAAALTLQGDQVFAFTAALDHHVYLPAIMRGP